MSFDDTYSSEERIEILKFGKLLGKTVFLTICVMVMGSLVRAADAGLACPDWPLCFDQVVPLFDTRIFLEWFHRLIAGTLIVTLVFSIVRLLRSSMLRDLFYPQMTAAFVLLVLQVALGALTVLKLLDPKIVSLHLINALGFLSLLIWMARKAYFVSRDHTRFPAMPPYPGLAKLLFLLSVLIFAQIALGGAVASHKAGLACPDFPTCYGVWIPDYNFSVYLQVFHRALGYAVLLTSMLIAGLSTKMILPPATSVITKLLPLLIIVQVLLGMIAIWSALPVAVSVLHNFNAILIFSLSLWGVLDLVMVNQLVRYQIEKRLETVRAGFVNQPV